MVGTNLNVQNGQSGNFMSNIRQPVIIIGAPRSRTSMVAGLFHKHGCWAGTCKNGDKHNPYGYFENLNFKQEIIADVGKIVHRGVLAPKLENWHRKALKIRDNDGYKDGPWMVKHSAMYYPIWHEFDPIYVNVRRNCKSIALSGQNSGMLRNPNAIAPHIEAMDTVSEEFGGVDIYSGDLIEGKYDALERAIEQAGMKFSAEICDNFINRSFNNYGG